MVRHYPSLRGLLQTATNDSSADIEFRVEDDAAAIAAVLNGDRDALDGANDLDVTSGTTNMAGAADIQSSGAYDAAKQRLHNHRHSRSHLRGYCNCN